MAQDVSECRDVLLEMHFLMRYTMSELEDGELLQEAIEQGMQRLTEDFDQNYVDLLSRISELERRIRWGKAEMQGSDMLERTERALNQESLLIEKMNRLEQVADIVKDSILAVHHVRYLIDSKYDVDGIRDEVTALAYAVTHIESTLPERLLKRTGENSIERICHDAIIVLKDMPTTDDSEDVIRDLTALASAAKDGTLVEKLVGSAETERREFM
ncbi:hypothetical protein WR25_07360 [Diploscapter pachys]|uniref:Uncharacterized protein n=1 Tax=Diploscapter pachys TaxID=2018661 RepID=A0A2A2KB55_9BILA|nr:hypothetical protein WR25_07360 [Diploscapter pachys]